MKILCVALLLVSSIKANVLVRDIGVVGLASHDLFAWDRRKELNTENGRLDLSTIFDFKNGRRWQKGGNPKNEENAPVYSITMSLVEHYQALLSSMDKNQARKETVKHFHAMVRESLYRLAKIDLPKVGRDEMVTNTEQAAMRALHDILPGRILLFRDGRSDVFVVTDTKKAKTRLNEKELNQKVNDYDGDYDPEYLAIRIPFPPITVNLKETDRKFIEKFSPYKQENMLKELEEVGAGRMDIRDVSFIHHIEELFSKAVCSKDNQWLPSNECF